MKQIYFVLTDTGTILSKIIKTFMRDEYAHVSIALDKELNQMYSFGRLNPYNPIIGGFVHEGIQIGTFKRFYKTKAIIIEYEITDEQFEKLKQIILEMWKNKNKYKFNKIGLIAVYFNRKIKRDNYFYCAEFIKDITEKSNINLNLPEIPRPENFKDIDGRVIYKGLLNKYNKKRSLIKYE